MPHYIHVRALILLLFALLSLAAAKSDSEIEADIRARLARSKIGANGFQVKVRNGVATWTGHAGVIQHKGAATRMAKAAGATRVDNRIEISAAAKANAAAKLRRNNSVHSRTEVRTQPRSDQPRGEPEPFVPPPVRRAVVKK
jgi:osmotically-inducible protein OsmY